MANPDEVSRIHRMEQIQAAIAEAAHAAWMYYTALLKEGFPEEYAFQLTKGYSQELWAYALAQGQSRIDP